MERMSLSAAVLCNGLAHASLRAQPTVSGRITDHITNAPVESSSEQLAGLSPDTEDARTYSAADGTNAFGQVPTGLNRLNAVHRAYAADSITFTAARDTTLPLALLDLSHLPGEDLIPATLTKATSPCLVNACHNAIYRVSASNKREDLAQINPSKLLIRPRSAERRMQSHQKVALWSHEKPRGSWRRSEARNLAGTGLDLALDFVSDTNTREA